MLIFNPSKLFPWQSLFFFWRRENYSTSLLGSDRVIIKLYKLLMIEKLTAIRSNVCVACWSISGFFVRLKESWREFYLYWWFLYYCCLFKLKIMCFMLFHIRLSACIGFSRTRNLKNKIEKGSLNSILFSADINLRRCPARPEQTEGGRSSRRLDRVDARRCFTSLTLNFREFSFVTFAFFRKPLRALSQS